MRRMCWRHSTERSRDARAWKTRWRDRAWRCAYARAVVAATDGTDGGAGGAAKQASVPVEAAQVPALEDGLRRAGIGQTSASVPSLLAQVRQLGTARARALVVNLLPQQPESMLPHALSLREMPRLLAGLQWLRRAVPARRTLLAFDRHDLHCRHIWRKSTRRQGVRLAPLLNQYPQAHPTVLLRMLLGAKLPVGALQTRVGAVMVDAVTLWAMGGYVLEETGFVSRPVEVFGAGWRRDWWRRRWAWCWRIWAKPADKTRADSSASSTGCWRGRRWMRSGAW